MQYQYSKSNLIKRICKGEALEYLFFWGHQPLPNGKVTATCLSQWWLCEFTDGDLRYCCFGSFDKIEELLPEAGSGSLLVHVFQCRYCGKYKLIFDAD